MKKPIKPRNPRKKINVLSTLFPVSTGDVSVSIPSIQADSAPNQAPKPLPTLKAPRKKINIPKSSIESLSETLVVAPPPPSLTPTRQPKPKASKPKIKIPLMLNIQPQKSEDESGLSDIPEISGSSNSTI
jgi:hypothetical protein